jgi:ABC-type antimicrobial peptide transport system permease subunit
VLPGYSNCETAIVRPTAVELAIGPSAGVILGVLATRVLSYIFYQDKPSDPIGLGGVIITMLAVGLVAAWIPALHALAVDPIILLRDEWNPGQ